MDNYSKESYDKIYSESRKYRKHYKDIRFYPVWDYISSLLDTNDNIIDIGCGPGHMAELLFDKGYKNYTGIDFSSVAIEKAKVKVPAYKFINDDLMQMQIPNNDCVYISVEAFEHIFDDIMLIRKLPIKSKLIFSVPSYPASNHYRTYKSDTFILNYYKDILNIIGIKEFYQNEKDIIFVINSIINDNK